MSYNIFINTKQINSHFRPNGNKVILILNFLKIEGKEERDERGKKEKEKKIRQLTKTYYIGNSIIKLLKKESLLFQPKQASRNLAVVKKKKKNHI